MENNKDKNKVYALELLNLLNEGTKEFKELCEVNPIFKSNIDFLKLRLNFIVDEKERSEYDEIEYEGYKNGKFVVTLYDPYFTYCDDGYWDWDRKARKTICEVNEDLSKVNIQTGNRLDIYEIKTKTLRK